MDNVAVIKLPDSSRKYCDGCTGITSSDPTTSISSNNVTEPLCNDDCCSTIIELIRDASKDECQATCCSKGDEKVTEGKCCSEKDVKKVVHDDCQSACQDTCLAGKEKKIEDDGCQDTSCSGKIEKYSQQNIVSACCEGKTSPCCDASCVDRIATRECESNRSKNSTCDKSRFEGTACESHKKRISHKAKEKPSGQSTGKDLSINESSVAFIQQASDDLEKGGSGNEYMALSITGMTCTGCETKLQRVLGTLPSISDLKTSLIMSRAEFSLDTTAMSPESVLKHLHKTTEFKCERISTQGSVIEVIPMGNIKEFLNQPPPLGVNDIQLADKESVRINFDPKVIGARSLIENNLLCTCSLAPPPVDQGLAASGKHVREIGYMTLLSIVLTIPVLVLSWVPIKSRPISYEVVSLALATIIQVVIAGPFYPKALKSLLFSRMIEMDLLIVLSTTAAYVFSVVSFGYLVSGHRLSVEEFFETSTLLVSLIMVGRWVAALSRQKAVESISIRSLQTSTVQLVTKNGTSIDKIDTRLLQYGDLFCVDPEQRIPTDGIVMSGFSEIDESMIIGESRPVEKHVGSKIIAGSINGSGKLVVQLTHLPGENTISAIASMIDDAKLSKPKIQDLADRVASYFVPIIACLTILTFVVWIIVGFAVQKKSGSDAAIQAVIFAITVLIISCPCAIGLAVPMVIVIGSGVAAERGVIFKSANSIEMAYKTTHVVFDKTGTLTEGKLKVVKEQYVAEIDSASRSMILGLVSNSKHPVSTTVAAHLEEFDIIAAKVDDIQTVVGNGIEGKVNGKLIRGGNARWLDAESDEHVQCVLGKGYTLFCVALDSKLYAVFGLSDTVRPEAIATVAKLRQRGIQLSVLSGDHTSVVQHIAAQIEIEPDKAQSHRSPSDKQQYIQSLLKTSGGRTKPIVVFVGDGTNDAVALAQATIGVHMSSGTDVAQSAADVVLMRQSLDGILTMIDISQSAVLRIKFNFGWSLVYNVLALLFASGALVSAHHGTAIKIPPQYAGLGELVSVIPVIVIAVSMRLAKI